MKKYIIKLMALPSLISVIWITNPLDEAFAFNQHITNNSIEKSGVELFDNFLIHLAQSATLYGCWRLTYSASGVIHDSLLRMDGYEGVMLTAFFSPDINDTVIVKQTMKLQNSSQGLAIYGYDPVYADTNLRNPTYSPDNFLFQIRPNGEHRIGTCDDQGKCSLVEVGECPQS